MTARFRQPSPLERLHNPDGEDFVMSTGQKPERHTLPICRCNHGRNWHSSFRPQATLPGHTPCNIDGCGCQDFEPVV